MHFAYILLREINAGRQVRVCFQAARFVDDFRGYQLRDSVDQAAAAQSARRAVAHRGNLPISVGQTLGAADGARRSAHAACDVRAFERGPGRRRARADVPLVREQHFAVGAHIEQKARGVSLIQTGK